MIINITDLITKMLHLDPLVHRKVFKENLYNFIRVESLIGQKSRECPSINMQIKKSRITEGKF